MFVKQSIVALIRPKLNLSQKESEASHLIEHILASPQRLEKMGITADYYAKNIIYNGGFVNDFYLAEYYIVKSRAAKALAKMLSKHQDELYLKYDDFAKIKSALIEEIHENIGEFIGRGEQISRAIYPPDSPTNRNPWNDLKSVENISFDETVDIFYRYNTDAVVLQMSFDDNKFEALPLIERNRLNKPKGTIELIHPWDSPGCVEILHIIPLPKNIGFPIAMVYRRSLTDFHFGLLQNELRNKQGLVYSVSIDTDYNNNSSEICFSSSAENSDKVTSEIKTSLKKYEQFIENNLNYIKDRLILELELDWGDIQSTCLETIDRVIFGVFIETPASLINQIKAISVQDLCQFNSLFLSSLNHEAILVKRRYGKSVITKIDGKLQLYK